MARSREAVCPRVPVASTSPHVVGYRAMRRRAVCRIRQRRRWPSSRREKACPRKGSHGSTRIGGTRPPADARTASRQSHGCGTTAAGRCKQRMLSRQRVLRPCFRGKTTSTVRDTREPDDGLRASERDATGGGGGHAGGAEPRTAPYGFTALTAAGHQHPPRPMTNHGRARIAGLETPRHTPWMSRRALLPTRGTHAPAR
jgi:hypothetical protein